MSPMRTDTGKLDHGREMSLAVVLCNKGETTSWQAAVGQQCAAAGQKLVTALLQHTPAGNECEAAAGLMPG